MKNYIKLLLLIFTVSLFTACDKNDELVVFDSENGQTLIQLQTNSATAPTLEIGVTTTEITVLLTTKSSSDRAITLDIDPATTATPDQYTISGLTVPSGGFSAVITITTNFDALPLTGSTFLNFSIASVGESTLVEKGDFTLEMFRRCPIDPADYVGTWTGTGSWSEVFGYTSEIVTTIDANGQLWITGLAFQWFGGWWGEVIVTNSPVKMNIDVDTEEITLEEGDYITSTWNGSPQPPYRLRGTGKVLNACEKTMVIYPVLVQNGGPIDGTAWSVAFKETVKLD